MEACVKELQTELSFRAFGTAVKIDNTVHDKHNNQSKDVSSI